MGTDDPRHDNFIKSSLTSSEFAAKFKRSSYATKSSSTRNNGGRSTFSIKTSIKKMELKFKEESNQMLKTLSVVKDSKSVLESFSSFKSSSSSSTC